MGSCIPDELGVPDLPMPGGAANKAGNRYERLWTALMLLDVLAGDADSLQIEVPGEAGRGAEFLLTRGSTLEWHQVKRQENRGSWTIQRLETAGVLAPWRPKLQHGDRCVFVSATSAQELAELAERASHTESWAQFHEHFMAPKSQRKPFDRLCRAWEVTGEAAYEALKNISLSVISENELGRRLQERLATLVEEPMSVAAAVLAKIVDDSPHLRLTALDVWERLAAEGVRRKTQTQRSHAPTGHLQNIQSASGPVFQVTGDRNVISLHGEQPARRRLRVLWVAGIITALILAAGVGYLESNNTGSLPYYQTGPAAGITVTATKQQCPAVVQNGYLSPAKIVFSDVSLVSSVSLDGRWAFLMQGIYDGSEYDWVIADPSGYIAGMRLRWTLNGHDDFCTAGIPAGAVTQLPRQVSTIAVPATISGQQVPVGVCIWYQQGKHQNCSNGY